MTNSQYDDTLSNVISVFMQQLLVGVIRGMTEVQVKVRTKFVQKLLSVKT